MRFMPIALRVVVLAGSLFTCAAWCQNGATVSSAATLLPRTVLFSVLAPSDAIHDGSATLSPAEMALKPIATIKLSAQGAGQRSAQVKSLAASQQVESQTCPDTYTDWWFWFVEPPCVTQQTP
jgi:hypothetical protein